MTPDWGCLWRNGLISAAGLQDEAISQDERERQRYVNEPTVDRSKRHQPECRGRQLMPWTTTCSRVTGLLNETALPHWLRFSPRESDVKLETPRKDAGCRESAPALTAALGDRRLPTRGPPTHT